MSGRAFATSAVLSGLLLASGCGAAEPQVDHFPMAGRPSAVVVAGGLVWVADDQGDVVWTVDPTDGTAVGDPLPVAANPISLAAGAATVWVGHAGGEVVAIDILSRQAEQTVATGGSIVGLAADGARVWAADSAGAELVEIFGTEIVRRVALPEGAVRVAVGEGRLWVTNSENTVTRVDADTGRADRTVEVGLGPIGLAVHGGFVWVANSDDGTVSRLEASGAGREVLTVDVGGAPVAVAGGLDFVWVVSQESLRLTRLVPATGEVVAMSIALDLNPRGVAVGEGAVWVAGTNPGGLVRVLLE